MVEYSEIENKIVEYVKNEILGTLSKLEVSETLDTLDLDSLDAIEILMFCEDEFNIEIDDEKAESCESIKDLVNLVDKLING